MPNLTGYQPTQDFNLFSTPQQNTSTFGVPNWVLDATAGASPNLAGPINVNGLPLPDTGGGGFGDLFTANNIGAGIKGLTGLVGAYTGLKQLGLAQDSFDFRRGAFNDQYNNQARLTNSRLEDRQRARVMRDPTAIPVAEYMRRFGTSERGGS